MSYIDTEKILNSSPKKRLIIGFENLKKNFNESTALEYSELYRDKSLSFILENSRMIFSEPFYGYEFYSDIVTGDTEYCAFPKYEVELEKINKFIEEHQDRMDPAQLKMYTDLRDKLVKKMDDCKNTTVVSQRIDDKTEDINDKISTKVSDALYDYKMGLKENDNIKCQSAKLRLTDTVGQNGDNETGLTYAPYINKVVKDSPVTRTVVTKVAGPKELADEETERVKESVLVSKLYADKAYQEAVATIPTKLDKIVFTGFAKESASEQVDEFITERVSSVETFYSTPASAVNSLFDDDFDSIMYKEEYDEFRNKNYGKRLTVFEYVRDLISTEYQYCNNVSDPIQGYDFFKEGTTIEEAFAIINQKCEETEAMLTEKSIISDEDISDDDIEDMGREVYGDNGNGDSSKKPEAPKPKNTANAVQFKAMDAEVKQGKVRAAAKQKGQEVRNAVKAVTKLPANIMDDIKAQIAKIDKADDDRRMKYMSEPGFRKKAIRNMRLSLLYGGAAKAKLSLVPVVMVCRHFSKQKDVRIRNQLVKDLETEIKICEEKINDASSNGDNQEKYKLMRIKSSLESEKVRVRVNSKYV